MIIAIDLGGTQIRLAAYFNGEMLCSLVAQTPQAGFDQVVVGLVKQIGLLTARFPGHVLQTIAMGVPGPVRANLMYGSAPLGVDDIIDWPELLAAQLSIPGERIHVRNDLQMAACFERVHGAGTQTDDFCLVSLSTGIGVAAVVAGQILESKTEMGHQVLEPGDQIMGQCTNHNNCWVSLASGSGITRRYATASAKTTSAIFQSVLKASDIAQIRRYNARALGNLVNAYAPDVIAFMGSLAIHQYSQIIPSAEELAPFTINRPLPTLQLAVADPLIGLKGAYYSAADRG